MITIFSKAFNLTIITCVFILICTGIAIALNLIYHIVYDVGIISKEMLLNVMLMVFAVVLLYKQSKT